MEENLKVSNLLFFLIKQSMPKSLNILLFIVS